MQNKKILITSAGGLTATYLIKYFSGKGIKMIGVDMSENIPLSEKLIKSYLVPKSNEPQFMEVIRQIVVQEDIDYIIPTSSYDMIPFSNFVNDSMIGTKMLIVDSMTNSILHNKRTCYDFLNSVEIETPKILEEKDIKEFPIVFKPVEGSGSKNFYIVNNFEELSFLKKYVKGNFIIEFLEGKEYTVDCLFDSQGKNKGFNIRERQKTQGGGVVVTQNDYSYEKVVYDTIKKLEQTQIIKGAINFQFKIVNGKVVVFDFNTRFASGGMPLTIASGFDMPSILLDLIDDKEIYSWVCPKEKRKLKMLRYYEEVFV